ncbi:chelatase [Ascoidea rubescens DSM 1968]|uniref:Chelatase n=1 Tax=Ascoidea rubescens DSM 1968 TaxID=1344418 RepID=A0A1D2VII9_9ASCO|nr:chelatase [Ascoidea rubescens DSM 1968]ODV61340.1 chelatase [Ascoidea rubescens DSM 1968]
MFAGSALNSSLENVYSTSPTLYHDNQEKSGTAIVMYGMGEPFDLSETHDFIYRMITDTNMKSKWNFLKPLIGKVVADIYTKKLNKIYEAIGGGSPLYQISLDQCSQICTLLDKIHPSTSPHLPYIFHRYTNPLPDHVLQNLITDNVKSAVALSHSPQFFYPLAGSCINEIYRQSRVFDPTNSISWSLIERWPTAMAKTFAKNINEKLTDFKIQFNLKSTNNILIVFSGHCINTKIVNEGDPYEAEVGASVQAVMEELNFSNPYRLCWQSGPSKESSDYLGPITKPFIQKFNESDFYDGIILVPISFSSDHSETLYEIDIELVQSLKKPERFKRVESLNCDSLFLDSMAEIISDHLDGLENGQGFNGNKKRYGNQLELDYKIYKPRTNDCFDQPSDFFKPL